MQILTITLVSLGLAVDCFAVSLAISTNGHIPVLHYPAARKVTILIEKIFSSKEYNFKDFTWI